MPHIGNHITFDVQGGPTGVRPEEQAELYLKGQKNVKLVYFASNRFKIRTYWSIQWSRASLLMFKSGLHRSNNWPIWIVSQIECDKRLCTKTTGGSYSNLVRGFDSGDIQNHRNLGFMFIRHQIKSREYAFWSSVRNKTCSSGSQCTVFSVVFNAHAATWYVYVPMLSIDTLNCVADYFCQIQFHQPNHLKWADDEF